ncbi:MAG: ADOP family duplicated permease [Vicinamibacteria bacterium]|nr:ADOP family duplicated permease [Vicinamibacteria bacterium]
MFHRIKSEIAYRLRTLFRRTEVEAELEAELQFHLERDVAKLMKEGLPRAEAERLARAEFGGLERIREDTRDAHGVALFDQAEQDLRYALRSLKGGKAFTFGVVTTLALGIGANATMFGILDRLLFRAPPSMRDPDTVHRLYRHTVDERGPRVDRNFSFATYVDLEESLRSLRGVAAFQTTRLAVGDGESVRELPVTVASASYFDLFEARPITGRFFGPDDDRIPEGAPVVVLGYGFWQSVYAGRNVVGERIRVGPGTATIIGIAPADFVGMSDQGNPALYMPITHYAFAARGPAYPRNYGWSWLELVARRSPGVGLAEARAEVEAGFVRSWRNAFASDPNWGTPEAARIRAELAPIQINRGPQPGRDARVAAWVSGVALIVLLIACANVANLLLSRAVGRRREIAVRLALGVSRARLTRQLLTESLLMALFGGALGLAIAQWGAAFVRRWFLPADLEVQVLSDPRTLLFSAVATLLVALGTGLVPALRAGRAEVASALKAGGGSTGGEHARLRRGLLVFQVALSVVLLVGAGLFVKSLGNANEYRLGYDADKVLVAAVQARGTRVTDAERRVLQEKIEAAASSVQGVSHVTAALSVPFWANDSRGLLSPGVDAVNRRGRFILQVASPEYFATMGTRILRGRPFQESDRAGSPLVVVVSEGMARVIWPGKDALGQCLQFQPRNGQDAPCMTVVGVAEEMHLRSWADAREFSYYVPARQVPEPPDLKVFARVGGSAADYVEPLRRRLQVELPGDAYVRVVPMSGLVEPNLQTWRLGATMFVAFGALALLLAAIGLYSLIAYDVAKRRRELSVRIALGASVRRVIGSVVGRGARLVALGIAIGVAIAIAAAPSLSSQMFQQSPRDPWVFGTVVLTLIAAGLAATALPALRASRVDPAEALREE